MNFKWSVDSVQFQGNSRETIKINDEREVWESSIYTHKIMERWLGKVAVVTGASSGIGAAICTELVKAGMIVCGLARRKDKVEQLRLSLFGAEGQLNAVECDITNEQSVKESYKWIEKTLGGIDMLVNNAGVVRYCLSGVEAST